MRSAQHPDVRGVHAYGSTGLIPTLARLIWCPQPLGDSIGTARSAEMLHVLQVIFHSVVHRKQQNCVSRFARRLYLLGADTTDLPAILGIKLTTFTCEKTIRV